MSTERKRDDKQVLGFVGVGLDNQDGHQRVTHGEFFLLVGGSEPTHERMQATAVRFTEELARRGRKLADTSPEEAADLLREALDP